MARDVTKYRVSDRHGRVFYRDSWVAAWLLKRKLGKRARMERVDYIVVR